MKRFIRDLRKEFYFGEDTRSYVISRGSTPARSTSASGTTRS